VRKRIAEISLVVALVLFLSGFLVLCYCPGWYALAAGFSGVTVWLGAGRMRAWGVLWVAASLVLTAVHAYAKVREGERVREILQRYEQNQRQDTNPLAPPNAVEWMPDAPFCSRLDTLGPVPLITSVRK